MARGTAVTAGRGRRGRQHVWWMLFGLVCVLLLASSMGHAPTTVLTATGVNADVALLGGVLLGGGLAAMLLRRAAPDVDTVLRDTQTRLFNREHADAAALRLIARDERDGVGRLALVLLSIDGAEVVGRRYGRRALDRLLLMVADTLRTQCREADLPCRFATGELAVYVHADGVEQAEAFTRRIEVLLESQQLDWEGDVLKPVIRCGVVMRHAGQSLADLQREAAARCDADSGG